MHLASKKLEALHRRWQQEERVVVDIIEDLVVEELSEAVIESCVELEVPTIEAIEHTTNSMNLIPMDMHGRLQVKSRTEKKPAGKMRLVPWNVKRKNGRNDEAYREQDDDRRSDRKSHFLQRLRGAGLATLATTSLSPMKSRHNKDASDDDDDRENAPSVRPKQTNSREFIKKLKGAATVALTAKHLQLMSKDDKNNKGSARRERIAVLKRARQQADQGFDEESKENVSESDPLNHHPSRVHMRNDNPAQKSVVPTVGDIQEDIFQTPLQRQAEEWLRLDEELDIESFDYLNNPDSVMQHAGLRSYSRYYSAELQIDRVEGKPYALLPLTREYTPR